MQHKIDKFFRLIKESKDFAYDVETSGLDSRKNYICGYSVSDGKEAAYVPVRHSLDSHPDSNISQVEQFEQELNKVIKQHQGKIIGHNIKFDKHFSCRHNIDLGTNLKDTMVRESLINENRFSYALGACTKNYDIPQKKGAELYQHIAEMAGCKPDHKSMAYYHKLRGDDPIAIEYAEFDTLSTMNLYLQQELHIDQDQLQVIEDLESNLISILQEMEQLGILIDLDEYKVAKQKIEGLHIEAYSYLPHKDDLSPYNVRSNKDLQEYFELCEIDNWEFTAPTDRFPEGQPSFNKDWLGTSDDGMVILNARKFDHLVNSFIEPFESFIHEGKIHTTFNQTYGEFGGTKSGRLSSRGPNLQQVPKRDEQLGRIFRKVFIPRKDFTFVEFDHSQAEPRLYAHYSNEPILIKGYNQVPFVDMHSIAAEMMHISRGVAKNLNLGILYTMGAPKLAKKLRISLDEARAIIRGWYRTFREVGNFTRRASEVAETRGYVRTILGRRARFPNPRFSYRAANRIIQGSSADILKWKMVEIDRWIKEKNYQDVVQMVLNIHDALLFQIHKEYVHLVPEIAKLFASVQEAPFNLRVPFHADYHTGNNWSEASYGV